MLIHSLELNGIRKFKNPICFNFKQGLNIIYGPNESGKTTLQEIIFHLLYTNVDTMEGEKQQSWFNRENAEARLVYETKKGEVFRLTKDYLRKKALLEIKEAEKWLLVTAQKEQVSGWLKKHWCLLDKKLFRNTFFVQQKHLGQLDKQESGKIKDLLTSILIGQEQLDAAEAENKLRQLREGVITAIEKNGQRLTFWQDEEEKYWNFYQVRRRAEAEIKEWQKELRQKEEEYAGIIDFWQQYEQLEKINRELNCLKEREKLFKVNLQEAEGYQLKIDQKKSELQVLEPLIGQVTVEEIENLQRTLTRERENLHALGEERQQAKKELGRLSQKIEQMEEGIDEKVSQQADKALKELEYLEQVEAREEEYLTDIKQRNCHKKLGQGLALTCAVILLFFGTYLVKGNFFAGMSCYAFAGSLLLFILARKNKLKDWIDQQELYLAELVKQQESLLHEFSCQNKYELKELWEDYQALQEEISLLMKELRLKKAKINKIEKKKKEAGERRNKIQQLLNEIVERARAEEAAEAVNLRKKYDNTKEERRAYQKQLWDKLGRAKLSDWQKKFQHILEDKAYLEKKLKEFTIPYPLSLVELQEEKNKEKELQKVRKELNLKIEKKEAEIKSCQEQYKFSLNQVRGEVAYWEKENLRLLEKSKAIQWSLSILQEALKQRKSLIYPQLEETVQQVFQEIRNSPSLKVELKDDLDVVLHLPDNISSYSSSSLSLGSLEQLYLTIRISLGRVLNRGENIPFFFDDVLVNFDTLRRMKTIQLLAKLAGEQQIFLFTHDLQDAKPVYGHILDLTPNRLGDYELEVG